MASEALKRLKDFLLTRKQAYALVFDNVNGRKVLKDLARFCRAHESTASSDSRLSAVLEGRREVWLRIQHQLQLSDDELWAIYHGKGGN